MISIFTIGRSSGIVEMDGDGYGAVYLPTDRIRDRWTTVEEIAHEVDRDQNDGAIPET